jgi:hypothetical protein
MTQRPDSGPDPVNGCHLSPPNLPECICASAQMRSAALVIRGAINTRTPTVCRTPEALPPRAVAQLSEQLLSFEGWQRWVRARARNGLARYSVSTSA